MCRSRVEDPIQTVEDVYKELQKDGGLRACFPQIMEMYELCLLIPQSTGIVERSFSCMNDLCKFRRTSLSTKMLESLMRINLISYSWVRSGL